MNSVMGTDRFGGKLIWWTPALLALGAAAASAPSPAAARPDFGVSVGVQHQVLVERDAGGRQLVKESGSIPRVGFDARWHLRRGGAMQASAELAVGTLNYDGQTWTGVPVRSKVNLAEWDFSVAWRPLRPAQWGEAWLVLRGENQYRHFDYTDVSAGATVETSELLLPGLRWAHSFQAASWRWQPSVELRASVSGHTDSINCSYVSYSSGPGPDDSSRDGRGHRRDVALGLDVGPVASPWSVGVAWTRTRQSASVTHTQPDWGGSCVSPPKSHFEIDNVMLRVRRTF